MMDQERIWCGPDMDRPVGCPCGNPGPLIRAGVQIDGQAILAWCPRCGAESTVVG
jgi:hypothetical protein